MKIQLNLISIFAENWEQTVDFYGQIFGFIEGKHVPHGHKNYLYN